MIEIYYVEPDLFEGLGNEFDIEEYRIENDCLIMRLYNDDEVTIPMVHIAYFEVH